MKFRIQPAFLIYISVIAWLSSWQTCICILFGLFVHELGHYTAARILGESIRCVTLTPFGGVMSYAPAAISSKGLRGFMIAAAGPAANYACILLSSIPNIQASLEPSVLRPFITANLAMLVLNLLPAFPLDGGRMVFSVGYCFFRVSALISCLSWLGSAVGILMLILSVYGLLAYNMVNCSLILIGIYLIVYALASKENLLSENLYVVVQERIHSKKYAYRLTFIQVSRDAPLYTLLKPMQSTQACCFVFKDAGGRMRMLDEQRICEELLKSPMVPISQVADPLAAT